MLLDILKGFIIGICASAPIGPVAILVIQKTLSKGHKAGFITGLGATFVDTVFSMIALSALAIAQNFIDGHKELILVCGGILVAVIGWFMMISDPFRKLKSEQSHSVSAKDFLQSLAMGFSNPGAILAIFALFAFFGIGPDEESGKWTERPLRGRLLKKLREMRVAFLRKKNNTDIRKAQMLKGKSEEIF